MTNLKRQAMQQIIEQKVTHLTILKTFFFQSMAKEINNTVIMYLNSGQDIDDDKNRYE